MEDYVSFELAAKLKEKGYPQYHSAFRSYFIGDDIPRIAEIGDVIYRTKIEGEEHLIACPSISQVLKWLRGKQLMVEIPINLLDEGTWSFSFRIQTSEFYESSTRHDYVSWEDAALACIEYILDNLI